MHACHQAQARLSAASVYACPALGLISHKCACNQCEQIPSWSLFCGAKPLYISCLFCHHTIIILMHRHIILHITTLKPFLHTHKFHCCALNILGLPLRFNKIEFLTPELFNTLLSLVMLNETWNSWFLRTKFYD